MGAADERLRRLADRQTPLIRRTIYAALARLSDASVEQLTLALETGDLERALRIAVAGLDELAAPLSAALGGVFGAAAKVTSASFGLRFDLTDPLAVRAAERQAAQLVVEISEETRRAVREIIAAGIRDGIPPRSSAREIMRIVGLTRRDATAVDTMWRRMLEDGVKAEQADARAARYAQRLLRRRAENIARTETITASTRGARAGWQAAADAGLLDPATARLVWIVTNDDRLCSRCAPMAGVTVGFVDGFTSTTEATGDLTLNRGGITPYAGETRTAATITVDGPPLHPSCRCAIGLVAV